MKWVIFVLITILVAPGEASMLSKLHKKHVKFHKKHSLHHKHRKHHNKLAKKFHNWNRKNLGLKKDEQKKLEDQPASYKACYVDADGARECAVADVRYDQLKKPTDTCRVDENGNRYCQENLKQPIKGCYMNGDGNTICEDQIPVPIAANTGTGFGGGGGGRSDSSPGDYGVAR